MLFPEATAPGAVWQIVFGLGVGLGHGGTPAPTGTGSPIGLLLALTKT